MLWSQSLCGGARVYVEKPDSSCFSLYFGVSSGPVGTNPDFFDRQVKGTILNLSYFRNFLWEPSFMLKSYRVGGSQSLCGGARVYVVAHKILVSAPVPF